MKQTLVNLLLRFSRKSNSTRYKVVSLTLGALCFLVMLPGVFIGIGLLIKKYVPLHLNRSIELSISIMGITAGLCFVLWAAITQWKTGNGTPAPNAPTRRLIISGPYTYCRNPIELGAIVYYLGMGTLAGGITAGIISCILGFTIGSIYHKCIEEKELEERFGAAYVQYKAKTPFVFLSIKIGNSN